MNEGLAGTLKEMAEKIASLERQIGELRLRERGGIPASVPYAVTAGSATNVVQGGSITTGNINASGIIKTTSRFDAYQSYAGAFSANTWASGVHVYNASGSPKITFVTSGYSWASYFGVDDADKKWKVGGWSMGANAYEIFHQGNPQVVMLTNEATVYGGANLGVGNYSINVTSYGIPSGCKAVIVRISGKWNTANERYFFTMKSSTNSRYPLVRAQVANMSIDGYGMAAVEWNILRYEVAGASSYVYLKILGYVK